MKTRLTSIVVLAVAVAVVSASGQAPVGTAFTYQGMLKQNGAPLDGQDKADLQVTLWDASTGGSQIGSPNTISNVDFGYGTFTVQLDFGQSPFAGDARWLEIAVRVPPGSGSFTILSPRQPITATPYGLYTLAAASADTVDGFHASATPTANTLLALNASARFPVSVLTMGAGSGLDADLLDGQQGAYYQNATNINAGTLADARLSSNVTLLNNAQTFTGAKTFSTAPSFSAAGTPFAVTATGLVSNLNADLLDSQQGSFYQNATNINAGTLADARLSSNVALLNTVQTFTTDKYFSGNVGIGTTSPASKLELQGTDPYLTLDTTNVQTGLAFQQNGATKWNLAWNLGSQYLYFWGAGAGTSMVIRDSTGNVGIGTSDPSAKLDVNGTAKMTGFRLGTSTTAGYVLTADASGVGTWQVAAPGGGIGGSGTASYVPKFTGPTAIGNSVIYESGGYVGVGTTSPTARLHLYGSAGWTNPQICVEHPTLGKTTMIQAGDGYLARNYYATGSQTAFGFRNATDGHLMDISADGDVGIGTSSPQARLQVEGNGRVDGHLELRDADNELSAELEPSLVQSGWKTGGNLYLYDHDGSTPTVSLTGASVKTTVPLDVVGAALNLSRFGDGVTVASLGVNDNNVVGIGNGFLKLAADNGTTTIDVSGNGSFVMKDTSAKKAIEMLPDGASSAGSIILYGTNGTTTSVRIDAAEGTGNGQMEMFNAAGGKTVQIDGDDSSAGGWIGLYKSGVSTATIELDATDSNGDSRITTQVLQITGGSDFSEQFDVSSASGEPQPGMVVCIDPRNPGKLAVSTKAYDRTVAGVISGAGGVKPGMLMGQRDSAADGQHPVALTGRVYVWCDASSGAIQPGDLLTSSATPGHAMKVTDHARAQGAILGKAMTTLESGQGLVLVLVSLQ